MKDSFICIVAAIALITVFAIPVFMMGGALEVLPELVRSVAEPEFGGPLGGALFLAYIFSLPLLGVVLLIYGVTKIVTHVHRDEELDGSL